MAESEVIAVPRDQFPDVEFAGDGEPRAAWLKLLGVVPPLPPLQYVPVIGPGVLHRAIVDAQRQHFDPPAARPTKGWPGFVSALITPECAWYALRLRLLWLNTNHGGERQWLRR